MAIVNTMTIQVHEVTADRKTILHAKFIILSMYMEINYILTYISAEPTIIVLIVNILPSELPCRLFLILQSDVLIELTMYFNIDENLCDYIIFLQINSCHNSILFNCLNILFLNSDAKLRTKSGTQSRIPDFNTYLTLWSVLITLSANLSFYLKLPYLRPFSILLLTCTAWAIMIATTARIITVVIIICFLSFFTLSLLQSLFCWCKGTKKNWIDQFF